VGWGGVGWGGVGRSVYISGDLPANTIHLGDQYDRIDEDTLPSVDPDIAMVLVTAVALDTAVDLATPPLHRVTPISAASSLLAMIPRGPPYPCGYLELQAPS
jgi:hypothetical protein